MEKFRTPSTAPSSSRSTDSRPAGEGRAAVSDAVHHRPTRVEQAEREARVVEVQPQEARIVRRVHHEVRVKERRVRELRLKVGERLEVVVEDEEALPGPIKVPG